MAAVYGTTMYFAVRWTRDAAVERKFAGTSPSDLADPYGWLTECSLLNYGFGAAHTDGSEATDPRLSKAARRAARAAWALRTVEALETAIELTRTDGLTDADPAMRELQLQLAAQLSTQPTVSSLETARSIYTELYTLAHSLPATAANRRQRAFCARAIIDLSVRLAGIITPDEVERADLRLLLAPLLADALSHALDDPTLSIDDVLPTEQSLSAPLSSSSQHAWLLSRLFSRRVVAPVEDEPRLIGRVASITTHLWPAAQTRDLASTLATTIALWTTLGCVDAAARLAEASSKQLSGAPSLYSGSQEHRLHHSWLQVRRALVTIYAAELDPSRRQQLLQQSESIATSAAGSLDNLPAPSDSRAQAVCDAVKATIQRDASSVGALAAMTIGLSHLRTNELDSAEAAFRRVKSFANRGKADSDKPPSSRDADLAAWSAAQEQIEEIRGIRAAETTPSESIPSRKLIWEINTWSEMREWLDDLDKRNVARIKRLFGIV